MNATEFAKGIPTSRPQTAECGGVGFAEIDGTCGSCETCMPPDFVARPLGPCGKAGETSTDRR